MNFLQDPTSFAYTGSQTGALPTTLDSSVNSGYLQQIDSFVRARAAEGKTTRIASIVQGVAYDTLRIDAAGALPAQTFKFFQNGVGSQQGLFVAGTQYRKQNIDVDFIINNGQLSKGYELLVWEIGVRYSIIGSKDESVQTSGNAINLTNDPGVLSGESATDAQKQANVLRACQEGLYFEFKINQTPMEHGPGWRFPQGRYGIGGNIALAGVVASPLADGAVQNGIGGWAEQLPVMRYLPEQTPFSVDMTVQNAFDVTNIGPFRITVYLSGLLIQPVTG